MKKGKKMKKSQVGRIRTSSSKMRNLNLVVVSIAIHSLLISIFNANNNNYHQFCQATMPHAPQNALIQQMQLQQQQDASLNGAAGAPIEERASLVHDSSLVLDNTQAQLIPSSAPSPMQPQPQSISNVEQQPQPKHQQFQIEVQPNSPVRIKCELPIQTSQTNTDRSFNWIFQPTNGPPRPQPICTEAKCLTANNFNVKLDYEPTTGAYDLVINSASYQLNDGNYYCDYYETENDRSLHRNYKLTVLLPPQKPTIVPSMQIAREGQEFSLSCTSSGANPEPNMTWYRNDQLISLANQPSLRIDQKRSNQTSTSTLTWIPTSEDNNALFKCAVFNKAMQPGTLLEQEHSVQVEYAPRVTVGPHNPFRVLQGQSVSLSCNVDANPPVKHITWLRDGQSIGSQFNHTISDIKISHSGIYSCQADNGIATISQQHHHHQQAAQAQAQQQQAIGSTWISNMFGLGSSLASSNSLMNEGMNTAVQSHLHLQVLYGPQVQIRTSLPSSSSSHLISPNKHHHGASSSSSPALVLSEGEQFSLNCTVESSPPPFQYIWTKQDDPTWQSSQSSPILEFSSIKAQEMGNYTCTAINKLEPSGYSAQQAIEKSASASLQVNVRHKPGRAELHLGQSGSTQLGSDTPLVCQVKPPGFPEPRYRFWKVVKSGKKHEISDNGGHPKYSNTLILPKVSRDDETKYVCSASNDLGSSGDADGMLIVNELPEIAKPIRVDDERFPGDDQGLTINFQATGKPEPKVTWWHRSPSDGRRYELSPATVPDFDAKYRIETKRAGPPKSGRYNIHTQLTFRQPLTIEDRGQYQVEFSNGLSASPIQDYQLHIVHPPIAAMNPVQLRAGPMPSSHSPVFRTKAGFDLGETVNLSCRVSAFPQPEFTWRAIKDNQLLDIDISAKSRYQMSMNHVRDDIWESVLTFANLHHDDYLDYHCYANSNHQKITNTGDKEPNLMISISLTPKTKPEPPTQIEAIESTQDSITLQWVNGFDGGFPNNEFIVEYISDSDAINYQPSANGGMGKRGITNSISGGSPSLQQYNDNSLNMLQQNNVAYQDQSSGLYGFNCESRNPCTISQLASRQTYTFRIKAKNSLGTSELSEEYRASTRANITQIPRIQEASVDASRNLLYYRIEPGSDYLLTSLLTRIEFHEIVTANNNNNNNAGSQQNQINELGEGTTAAATSSNGDFDQQQQQSSQWRSIPSVPVKSERGEASLAPIHLNNINSLRLTLCSRLNETLCGPDYVIGMRTATSSFLQDQGKHLINFQNVGSGAILFIIISVLLTGLHMFCFAKSKKKADSIERVDTSSLKDAKHAQSGNQKSGSTTSTNSTSAGGGNGQANGNLASMDSLMMGVGQHHQHGLPGPGTVSDHSSDHSRQAKFDSMIPPNYNHYADRATLMQEQEQQQLDQQQQQYLQSAYNQQNQALLGLANQTSPVLMGHQPFSYTAIPNGIGNNTGQYGQTGSVNNQSEYNNTGNLPMSLDNMHLFNPPSDQMDVQHQQAAAAMWAATTTNSGQVVDDYSINNYNNNALINNGIAYQSIGAPVESAYGTIQKQHKQQMQQQSSMFDQNVPSTQSFNGYMTDGSNVDTHMSLVGPGVDGGDSSYQQEMAAAQQQIYGTLNRTSQQPEGDVQITDNNNILMQQQQQQQMDQLYNTTQAPVVSLMGSNGLQQQQPIESDYGPIGSSGRSGRLIREIIV